MQAVQAMQEAGLTTASCRSSSSAHRLRYLTVCSSVGLYCTARLCAIVVNVGLVITSNYACLVAYSKNPTHTPMVPSVALVIGRIRRTSASEERASRQTATRMSGASPRSGSFLLSIRPYAVIVVIVPLALPGVTSE